MTKSKHFFFFFNVQPKIFYNLILGVLYYIYLCLDLYCEKLVGEGIVTKEEVDAVIDKYEQICEEAYKKAGEETQVPGTFTKFHSRFRRVSGYMI